MNDIDFDKLTFVPFFRRKFPIQSNGNPESARREEQIELRVLGKSSQEDVNTLTATATLPIHFYGPSDIQGIRPDAIARVEPERGATDFEPNYFPFIEFRDPDFIWRYSLSDPNDPDAPQQPWLALLVFSKQELAKMSVGSSKAFRQNSDGRWILDVSPDLLPIQRNPQIDWQTGHMQIHNHSNFSVGEIPTQTEIENSIQNFPEQNCSRLFCFRKLEKETAYFLFLVPYYLAGVTGSDESGHASIFDISERTQIPVYYHSYFTTSEKGDFEYLARKLKRLDDPPPLGTAHVDITKNLEEIPDQIPSQKREGALAAPGYSSTRKNSYRTQIDSQIRTDEIYEEVEKELKNQKGGISVTETEDGRDPLVTLPYYGKHYQKFELRSKDRWEISNKKPRHWSEELNLDLRNRISAGFGTHVIRKNQQKYLKECWLQVGDLRLANEKLLRTQAGYTISKSIQKRYIDSLSHQAFFLLSRPFHSHFAFKNEEISTSIKKRIDKSGLPLGSIQPTFLRFARQRLTGSSIPLFDPWEKSMKPFLRKDPRQPLPIPKALFEPQIKRLILPMNHFTPMLPPKIPVINVKPFNIPETRAKFDVKKVLTTKLSGIILSNDREKGVKETFDPILVSPKIEDPMYRPLKSLSIDYILPGINKIPQNSVLLCEENRYFIESYLCGANDEMGRELVWNRFPTDQRGTIFSFFWDSTRFEDETQEDLNNAQKMGDIRPIHLWKRHRIFFRIPRWLDRLRKLLKIPRSNIRTLRRIASSYGVQLSKIRRKKSYLGMNPSIANKDGTKEGRIVLLLKGDLIRRYPDTVIYALKRSSNYVEDPDLSTGTTISPSFRANLSKDIVGIGFPFTLSELKSEDKYYFVLQEQQDLPRFGLDIDTSERRQSTDTEPNTDTDPTWSNVDYGQIGIEENEDPFGYILDFKSLNGADPAIANSAEIANLTLQRPIQMIISAKQLLRLNDE